jgi:nitrate reductase gamma subunit
MTDTFLFITAPYAAAAALPVVLMVRWLIGRRRPQDLRERAAQAARIFGGSRVWLSGLLALLAGHLLGLLFPRQVLLWNDVPMRLFVLEGTAHLVGLLTLVALVILLGRRLLEPGGPSAGSVADLALLSLLLVQIVSGLSIAALYRWASTWSVVTLGPYVASLLRLKPRLELIASMPYLVKLHVFSATAALAVLPWTHLIYLFLYPSERLLAVLRAPAVWLAAQTRPRIVQWGRRVGGAATLWWDDEE